MSSPAPASPPPSLTRRGTTPLRQSALTEQQEQQHADAVDLLTSQVETQRLSAALKLILEYGWENKYDQIIKAHVRRKDQEIKKICNEHYEEFIGSIDELVNMKFSIKQLKDNIIEVNANVQDTGTELVEKGERLLEYRRVLSNIETSLDVTQRCAELVELAVKAQAQVQQEKYFPALKTLDDLQRHHLPQFADFQFAAVLGKAVPRMMLSIKEAVRAAYLQWIKSLETSEKKCGHFDIGVYAMEQVQVYLDWQMERVGARRKKYKQQLRLRAKQQARQNRDEEEKKASGGGGGGGGGALNRVGSVMDFVGDEEEVVDEDEDEPQHWSEASVFDKIQMTFTPVYQCLHIHENLNRANEFINQYAHHREGQLANLASLRVATPEEFLQKHMAYFASLAGFFLVEDAVAANAHTALNADGSSSGALMSRPQMEKLWESAFVKIKVLLRDMFEQFKEPAPFLRVKYAVVLFCKALETTGLPMKPLLGFLAQQREQLERGLFARLKATTADIFAVEKFEPLLVRNEEQYRSNVLAYDLQADSKQLGMAPDEIHYPTTMPFSISVPRFCKALKQFATDYYDYSYFLSKEMTENIVRGVEKALREINTSWTRVINQPNLHISQAAQFAINAGFIAEEGCNWLKTYLVEKTLFMPPSVDGLTSMGSSAFPSTSLSSVAEVAAQIDLTASRTLFVETRIRCQDLLFEIVDSKIDSVMDLNDFAWLGDKPNRQPTPFIEDLVAYLSSTFTSLEYMTGPLYDRVREALHFTACKHVNGLFMEFMLGPSLKSFNMVAVHNLNQDLKELEAFAQRCQVKQLDETFSELRQLVDLLLSAEPGEILDSAIAERKYPHLSSRKVSVILGKYKDLGFLSSLPAGMRVHKKKTLEAIAKKLTKS